MLETPCVYDKEGDELYEVDDEAAGFLLLCDGTKTVAELGGDPGFVEYCLEQGILSVYPSKSRRVLRAYRSPAVSLRYLELHITSNCNLRCGHCYLSAGDGRDMDVPDVFSVMDEFDEMQGLRLMFSGGEPLVHKGFWEINDRLPGFGFRTALLTNGTLVTGDVASRLNVNEVQVSLDGMEEAHDSLRGRGSYTAAVKAIEHLLGRNIKVSVATTINALNRNDFDDLGEFLDSLGVSEWNIDAPSGMGRMRDNPGLMLSPYESARLMMSGFGGSHHGGKKGFACGSHLCAVGADGAVSKCGFYLDRPAGNVSEGLRRCWDRLEPLPLGSLSCDCDHVEECRGGCRFRASTYSGEFGPDPVMCYNLGVNCNMQPKGGERS